MDQVSQSLIRLQGSCNLRTLGAHASADGRRLRAGRLFRSGVLAYLSPADHEQLLKLGIRAIVDLRRGDERRREPTRWCSTEVLILEADDESTPSSLLRFALRGARSAQDMRQAMVEVYRAMPESLADRLRALFACLDRGDVPLLVHCAAGKDRTGFAVAVILEALRIDRQIVLQDYLFTNQAVDLERFVLDHHNPSVSRHADGRHPLKLLDQGIRDALLRADAEYLSAALDAIQQRYGSVDSYLRQRVGVTPQMLARVRDVLLE